MHADIYTFLAPHGVRQDTAHRSPLVRFETSLGPFTHFLNAESAFENSNQNIHSSNESVLKLPLQIYPDLIAPAALISLMSLVSLTCLNFLSSPSHSRWSSVDIIRGRFRDMVDRSRSCNVYPRFVTACYSRIPICALRFP